MTFLDVTEASLRKPVKSGTRGLAVSGAIAALADKPILSSAGPGAGTPDIDPSHLTKDEALFPAWVLQMSRQLSAEIRLSNRHLSGSVS